ncbi:MAG: hypothetical protein KC503_21265 [Myxococcales bacterium]|nr:hypothetical protein [Myxococcales bacterium]
MGKLTTTCLCALALLALEAAPAHAQIPLPGGTAPGTTRRARRRGGCDKLCQVRRQIAALKAQRTMIGELRSWAWTQYRGLQRVYRDSEANFRSAQQIMYTSRNKRAPTWQRPQGLEVETARVSDSSVYPSASKYKVPVVDPEKIYVHVQTYYPREWIADRQHRISIDWYIFDHRFIPMAAEYQKSERAVHRSSHRSHILSRASERWRHHVQGLGLLPGRYFVAGVFREVRPYRRYSRGYRYRPRQAAVSLGVFRVTRKAPPGVDMLLPHYRDWYRSYGNKVTLTDVKVSAAARGRFVNVRGRFKINDYKRDMRPAIIEVKATGQNRNIIIYRQRKKIRRADNRFSLRIKGHTLAHGRYKLRVTVYTEHKSGRRYYRPWDGARAEQNVDLELR